MRGRKQQEKPTSTRKGKQPAKLSHTVSSLVQLKIPNSFKPLHDPRVQLRSDARVPGSQQQRLYREAPQNGETLDVERPGSTETNFAQISSEEDWH